MREFMVFLDDVKKERKAKGKEQKAKMAAA
ncbi:MAG: hypothetical protein KF893_02655 [Caldilineaceae bacterium]|nr:hypothetical protein [Caldilineaceae bacterium]